jgi:hypothetical protein
MEDISRWSGKNSEVTFDDDLTLVVIDVGKQRKMITDEPLKLAPAWGSKAAWLDPFICSRCIGPMRVISFIEDGQVIRKILNHLGLWQVKCKPQPTANALSIDVFPAYDEQPGSCADDYIIEPDYPVEANF